jgi:hypothetical protein
MGYFPMMTALKLEQNGLTLTMFALMLDGGTHLTIVD